MKTSLKKLRGFAQLHHQFKHDRKDNKIQPLAQLDELDKASQDLQEMRDCYDSLLSAAAAAANSAYEFSESFREMGSCLLQKIELNEDEETGKVLLMLGKSQFELQRLVDNYRSHIFHTITVPSESLLNELRTVEEMKLQCDEKRELYDYMKTKHKEKGKSRGSKGDTFSTQQLQAAKDEFDEEATLFVFRLKSLRQGQSRSLLTQAARHHAAQICFIRKALKSLEAVEPHVKSVTEQQHIDYHFTGLEDDDESEEDGEDEENDADDSGSDGSSEDSEPPSFDRRHNAFFNSLLSASRRSMDVDLDMIYPPLARMDGLKEDVDSSYDYMRERQKLTQSAPLLAPRQFDPLERIRQLRPSATKKFHSYVLPTPGNAKSPNKTITTTMKTSPVQTPKGFYHSAPLEPKKHETQLTDLGTTKNSPEPANILNTLSILKENINSRTPSPLGDKPPTSPMFPHASSEPNKKVKRHSLSGSMTNKPMVTNTRSLYAAADPPQFSPGPILRTPMPKSASTPRINSHSLRISELHELPRPPPIHLGRNLPASPHGLVGYSAPLLSRSPENSTPRANLSVNKVGASPLPTPPAIHNLYPTTGSGSPRSSSRVFEPADELEKGEDNYGASPPPPINRREFPSRRST